MPLVVVSFVTGVFSVTEGQHGRRGDERNGDGGFVIAKYLAGTFLWAGSKGQSPDRCVGSMCIFVHIWFIFFSHGVRLGVHLPGFSVETHM